MPLWLVLLRLVADNASLARALYLSVHLVNTFLLVAALALTAWWATDVRAARARLRDLPRGHAGAALFAALALGVSGAVAALGATLFPESAQAIATRDTSPSAQLLFSLRQYKLHPLLASAVCAYLVYFALRAYRTSNADVWARRWAVAVLILVVTQLGAGLMNAALLAPVWLQIVHLLLADLLWLALVLLSASSLAQTETPTEELVIQGGSPIVREGVSTY